MNKLEEKFNFGYEMVDKLLEFPGNPRIHTQKSKDEVKKSFLKHGFVGALIVNTAPGRENIVLSGNLRLIVARELGMKEVPVIKIRIDDPKIEQELVLLGNINNGDWDIEALRNWDIKILLDAGMKDYDISAILDDMLSTESDGFDVDKEIQQIKVPKTKTGEIYQLGRHVIGCGDSTDSEFVKKLLGDTKVDMIYTDTKFNIGLSYNSGIGGKSSYGGHTDDNMSDDDYKDFLKKTISNALSVAKPDCHVFFYSDQLYVWLLQEIYRDLGINSKRLCLWLKNGINPTPQVAFNKSYEPVLYGTIGKPFISQKLANLSEVLNRDVASGNRQIDDILDMMDIWLVKRLAGQDYTHSTEKPITLHEKPIRRCTKVNDVVLDLASGSGSTLIACEQLKRRCYTLDIEPIFCDLVIKRFKDLTGEEAKLISGGQNGKN
ncbi:MAG: DNA modification methylase [Patescibacteria group bacterium]